MVGGTWCEGVKYMVGGTWCEGVKYMVGGLSLATE